MQAAPAATSSQPPMAGAPAWSAQTSQRDARGAGRECESRNARLHGPEGDVALAKARSGPSRSGWSAPLQEVPEIVHQVGRALHQQGANARHSTAGSQWNPRSVRPVRSRSGQDDRLPRLWPDGQNPCGEGVGFTFGVFRAFADEVCGFRERSCQRMRPAPPAAACAGLPGAGCSTRLRFDRRAVLLRRMPARGFRHGFQHAPLEAVVAFLICGWGSVAGRAFWR